MKKARPKIFIKTAYPCGFRWVNVAMAKICHPSVGQLCFAKC
ncbi:MAG: hypothetical protein AB7E42_02705 [Anaerotignaceae bacterium]